MFFVYCFLLCRSKKSQCVRISETERDFDIILFLTESIFYWCYTLQDLSGVSFENKKVIAVSLKSSLRNFLDVGY